MRAIGCSSRWAGVGVGVALLLAGCTGSTFSTESSPAKGTAVASAVAPLACDGIEVSDVETSPGDWVLAEAVLLLAPEGTQFSVTLTADAPARVEVGDASTLGRSQIETDGLNVEEATVTTDPASDLDAVTLVEALDKRGGDLLWLDNVGNGFTYELDNVVGPEGTVVYRGAKEVAVTFTGECSGPAGDPAPVTGTARLFDLGEVAPVACGQPTKPGSLAETAAELCATE